MQKQNARNIFNTYDNEQAGKVKVWKIEIKIVRVQKQKRGFFESCVGPKPVDEVQRVEIVTPSPVFEEGVRALNLGLSVEDIKTKVEQIATDAIGFDQYRRFLNLDEELATLSRWRSLDHQSSKSGGQYRGFIHEIYGSCVIISANPYDPIRYRTSKVERLLPFSDLNAAKAQTNVYESFQTNELERYGGRVIGGDYEEVLARLTDDAQGGALEEGEGTWGAWDFLAQSHSLVCRGQQAEQMRCLFLTPTGFTLFGRDAKTVAADKGEVEELGRIAALQRLADEGYQVRNVGQWRGPCLYVASTGLTDVSEDINKVRGNGVEYAIAERESRVRAAAQGVPVYRQSREGTRIGWRNGGGGLTLRAAAAGHDGQVLARHCRRARGEAREGARDAGEPATVRRHRGGPDTGLQGPDPPGGGGAAGRSPLRTGNACHAGPRVGRSQGSLPTFFTPHIRPLP